MVNLKKIIFAAVVGAGVILTSAITSYQTAQADDALQYKAGDLLSLPMQKGNYVMLLWGGNPIWYDGIHEWFSDIPIRNYSTIYLDITRQTPTGDYQFIEIDADGDPRDLSRWRWIRSNAVRIVKCDGFRIC